MQLKLKKFTSSLSEISQQTHTKFALCSPKKEQIIPFCLCRDFLHDIIRWDLTKKKGYIYGMEYDGTDNNKTRVDLKNMKLLVTGIHPELALIALDIINLWEREVKLPESYLEVHHKIDKSFGKALYFLFNGDKKWLQHPVGLSLYSFFIKLAATGFVPSASIADWEAEIKKFIEVCGDKRIKSYAESSYKYIKPMMYAIAKSKGYNAAYTKEISNSRFHDYSGIVAVSSWLDHHPQADAVTDVLECKYY